jgi:exonuclease VII small subunit
MIYGEHVESTMRADNARLIQQLRDTAMDLEDATKTRRQLQHRLQDVEERMGLVLLDNDKLKVDL